jgi:hypothetical protein
MKLNSKVLSTGLTFTTSPPINKQNNDFIKPNSEAKWVRQVLDMLVDIQWAFSSLVRSADWMDKDTKTATLEKAAAVKHFVGFPEWLLDKDELERYYEGVSKLCPCVFVNVEP